jgi:hypothetical protein
LFQREKTQIPKEPPPLLSRRGELKRRKKKPRKTPSAIDFYSSILKDPVAVRRIHWILFTSPPVSSTF